MEEIRTAGTRPEWLKELKSDCENCRGICCAALYFSKNEGFPFDKEAGVPCLNLTPDFRCGIHAELLSRKLKGCMAYDCLGAGQRAAQAVSAREDPGGALMHRVFPIIFQLHQTLWYLTEASAIVCAAPLYDEINGLIEEINTLTHGSPEEILNTDIAAYKLKAGGVLKKTAELVRKAVSGKSGGRHAKDYIGRDFKQADLTGKDFSAAWLIAANLSGCNLCGACLLGADMRDADIEDADLSQSIFLTQMQLNSARGSRGTKLSPALCRPAAWAE